VLRNTNAASRNCRKKSTNWKVSYNKIQLSSFRTDTEFLPRPVTKVSLHRVSKNVPPLACYNFDADEWILIFFDRNVTDKVGNQKTLYMPPQITCASALPDKTRKHENHIFHSIGLCYTHNAPVRYLPERKKCHL